MPARTFHHSAFSAERIAGERSRRGLGVAVCLPARECAATVGEIVEALQTLRSAGAVDRIVVVDAASPDGTARVAEAAGAEVWQEAELLPSQGAVRGKGDAMWRALSRLHEEIVCFLDADSEGFSAHFATGLIGPLACEEGFSLAKAFYRRPLSGGALADERAGEGGGRVNHLTARPALALLYPELAEIRQPLAGEVAARRELLLRLPFMTGYGVEVAMLIDAWREVGLEGIAQVDLEEHRNRHQALAQLAPMAATVLATVLSRAQLDGRLTLSPFTDVPAHVPLERPPLASLQPSASLPPRGPAAERGSQMSMRCLYLDLDGTLLGRGASLLHDGEGGVSLDGVRAVQACLRADVEVVLMSGRRRAQVAEDARLLGQASYIYEAGACVVLDSEEHWLTGDLLPGELTIAEQIERSGAPAMLLEHYAGRLEYHDPWHLDREVSHLFRGLVDAFEVDALLAEHGHAGLRLVDNGVVNRRSPALAELPHVRGYHLVPKSASKASAVAFHRQARGYSRQQTFAVGDSREDLACAAHVHELWLVANALARDPSLREDASRHENARVAEAGYGAGVYEAVVSTLVER